MTTRLAPFHTLALAVSAVMFAPAPTFAGDPAAEGPFTLVNEFPPPVLEAEAWIRPKSGQLLRVNPDALAAALADAPLIDTPEARANPAIIALPMPDGTLSRFAVFESPILEPGLAQIMPDFRSYAGQGIDDPYANVRFDTSLTGFHAFIRSPSGDVFIDPFSRGDAINHVAYHKSALDAPADWSCAVTEVGPPVPPGPEGRGGGALVVRRVYRIAIAATGEYTQYHGGVNQALNAIAVGLNRINAIYIPELAIQFNLVANNNLIVYPNPNTDPYPEPGAGQTRTDVVYAANQAVIDNRIGNANYDIGHVLDTRSSGLALREVVCTAGQKARGVTGRAQPINDPFWVDYVCHEIGHQCGANHTFNNNTDGGCGGNRAAGHAYEPGSGSTIMAYAGLCTGDNLQGNSDAMFHAHSIFEITEYMRSGGGAGCGTAVQTNNHRPTFYSNIPPANIPANTPFHTGIGFTQDNDGDARTLIWEQLDSGANPRRANAPDDGSCPLFRSWMHTSQGYIRYLPRLQDVFANTTVYGENYPTTDRTLHFRCTVRDNRADGGGTNTQDREFRVVPTAGPFRVTSPNTAVVWNAGPQTVTWNRANTHLAPINCGSVFIELTTDGGATWTDVLGGTQAPNNGSAIVNLPQINTNTARIRVSGGRFYDVSDANFTIVAAAPPAAPTNVTATPNTACAGNPVTLSATVGPGETVAWYRTACGVDEVGRGNPITHYPGVTGLVYARAYNPTTGLYSTACGSVNITVPGNVPAPPQYMESSRNRYCHTAGGNITLTAYSGEGTTLRWYSPWCGGNSIGTGAQITIPAPRYTTTYLARWETPACGVSECAGITVVVINPDWNRDGRVNSQDFFDFLNAFFAGAADFNGDLRTDSQDFFDFVNAFLGGC